MRKILKPILNKLGLLSFAIGVYNKYLYKADHSDLVNSLKVEGYFLYFDQVRKLTPTDADLIGEQGLEPSLMVSGNEVRVFDKKWIINEPGNYLIVQPFKKQFHFIKLSESSLESALILSRLMIRGNADNALSVQQLYEKALNQFIYLTCYKSSRFVNFLLDKYGYKSRIVLTHTTEVPNHYNDSHAMLEVFENNRWILVDIDKKCFFETKNGDALNLMGFLDALKDENVVIKKYSSIDFIDWSGFKDEHYSTEFQYNFLEFAINNDLQSFYKRVCGFGGFEVSKNENYVYGLEGDDSKYGVNLTREKFEAKFYT